MSESNDSTQKPYHYHSPTTVNLKMVENGTDASGQTIWAYQDTNSNHDWPILGADGTDKTIVVTTDSPFSVNITAPAGGYVRGSKPSSGWDPPGGSSESGSISYRILDLVQGYDFEVEVKGRGSSDWIKADPLFKVKPPIK